MNNKSINDCDLIVAEELWNEEFYHIYFYDIEKVIVLKEFAKCINTKYNNELFDVNYSKHDLNFNFGDSSRPLLIVKYKQEGFLCKLLFKNKIIDSFYSYSIDNAITKSLFKYPNIFSVNLSELDILNTKLELLEYALKYNPIIFFNDKNSDVTYLLQDILFVSTSCFMGEFLKEAILDTNRGFFIIQNTKRLNLNGEVIYKLIGQGEFIKTYYEFVNYKELLLFIKKQFKGRCSL